MVAKGGGAFLRPQTASRKGWKIGLVPQIPLLEPGRLVSLFSFGKGALDLGKGPRRCLHPRPGAGGNPLAIVEPPAPKIDAPCISVSAPLALPAAHQRPQLGGHRGDDGGACHTGVSDDLPAQAN